MTIKQWMSQILGQPRIAFSVWVRSRVPKVLCRRISCVWHILILSYIIWYIYIYTYIHTRFSVEHLSLGYSCMYFTIFSTKNGSNPWLIAHGRLPPRSAASFRCSEGWSGRWDSPGPVEIAISKNGSTGKIGFLEWFQISQLFQIHLVIDDHWGSPGSPSQVSLGLSHLSFELQQCTASVLRVAKSQRCRPWMDRNPDYSIGGPFLEWINSVLFSVYSYLLSRSMENLMKKHQ